MNLRHLPLQILARIARIFGFLPMRYKLGLITILSTFLVCAITAYIILTSYQKERVTYVFETHQHAVEAVAANINSSIRAKMAVSKYEILNDLPQGLTRLPDSSEFILNLDPTSKEAIIYARSQTSDLIKFRLPASFLLDSLNQVSHQRVLILNQESDILAATQDKKPQAKTKQAITDHLNSGMFVEGTSLINLAGRRTAASHREIKNSNLIVLALTNIDTITQDLMKTVARWLLIALPIFIASAFFQSVYVGKITAPLYQLIDRFTEISQGNFGRQALVTEGEFQPILVGASKMQTAIQEREQRLLILSMCLKKLMDMSQNRRNLLEHISIVNALTEALLPFLSKLKTTPILWIDAGLKSTQSININGQNKSLQSHPANDLIDLDGLARYRLPSIEPSRELPFINSYQSEELYVMVIPFMLEDALYGWLFLPIKSGFYNKELDEFATLVFRMVESIFMENRADELKVKSLLISNELALARTIQEKTVSVQGEIRGAAVEWLFKPAQVVGGDLLMIYQYSKWNAINFYLGDVTGHGVDSAFHTSLIAGAIEFHEGQRGRESGQSEDFKSGKDLSTLSKILSDLLLNKGSGKYMSLCAGTLFADTGELVFVLAGHPPPIILDRDFNLKTITSKSTTMGLIGEPDFPEHPELFRISLAKGDSVLIYTDGLIENAVSSAGAMLSRKKLSKKLGDLYRRRIAGEIEQGSLPQVLMDWTKEEYDAYEMKDDVAILVMHYQ